MLDVAEILQNIWLLVFILLWYLLINLQTNKENYVIYEYYPTRYGKIQCLFLPASQNELDTLPIFKSPSQNISEEKAHFLF